MLQGDGNGQVSGVIGGGTNTGAINVVKSGAGTWTLSGANTYTGSTTINGGTLVLSSAGSIASSSAISVQTGTVFDVTGFGSGGFSLGSSTAQKLQGTGTVNGTVINGSLGTIAPGGDATAGTLNIQNLTLGSTPGGIVDLDLSNSTSSGNDLLNVTGTLAVLGSANSFNINMLNGVLATGTYKLVNYGTFSGSIASISLTGVGSGASTTRQSFGLSRTGNEIDLNVTGSPANLTWVGGLSSNIWDRGSTGTKNWKNTSSGNVADYYYDLDNLTFDNTGSTSPAVNVSGAWAPSLITVNSSNNYTFTGTGSITGGTSMTLTKSGAGTLILANTGGNNFGGGVIINAGTLQMGDGVTLGAGAIGSANVTLNGTLVFNRPDDLTMSNLISGSVTGNLVKQGASILTLSGTNTYTGSTTIQGGTITVSQLANGGTASRIGQSTNAAANLVINGGTLQYTGAAVGTDRLFTLARRIGRNH